MKTVKEYLAKMGKMPKIQYRFRCPMCGLNSNANKLQQTFTPKLMMRAYLGRAGIEFFEPNSFPDAIKKDFEMYLVAKCKAILKYFNEPVYSSKFDYLPRPSSNVYSPTKTALDFGIKTEVAYGD